MAPDPSPEVSPDDPFPPGARAGALRIERLLGRGAYGRVYRALDTRLGRPVALKVFATHGLLAGGDAAARLRREARAAARLKGPHVVRLYQALALRRGYVGLVYELVEAGSLESRLEAQRRLPPAEAARVVGEILRALEEAEAQGVVHCDVKPANVLLDVGGTAKLTDFGQAALAELRSGALGGGLPGSPAYQAPEVLAGAAPTARSDLWSVGVLAYRALAGREPFTAEDVVGLYFAIHDEPPEALPPDVPAGWREVLARLLAKRPEDRPATALEARRLVERLAAAPAGHPEAPAPRAAWPAGTGSSEGRGGPASLVGREAEGALLDGALRALASGRGGSLALLGEAGLGKSALVAVARSLARQAGLDVLEIGFAAGAGLWAGLARALRERRRRGHEPALLRAAAEEPVSRTLRVLLGEGTSGEAAEHKDQAPWALETLLAGVAAERPTLLVAEDLHEASAADLALLAEGVRRLAGRPLLTLATARTGYEAAGPGEETALGALAQGGAFPLTERVELAPLGREDVDRLVTLATGGCAPAAPLLAQLVRQGGGNPLWTLEVLRHLLAQGAAERRGRELVPGPAFGRVGVPPTYRGLVASRFRGLSPADRALVEVAAVDGIDFDGRALAEVLGEPLLPTLRRLQELARSSGLFAPGPRGVRFAHALIRDALVEELLPEYRRALHRALAERLEARPEGAEPERTGTHWERAGEAGRAAPHLLAAALAAARRQEHARTLDLLERAGLAPERLSVERAHEHADLLLMAVHAYAGAGRRAEQRAVLERLAEAAERAHDEVLALRTAIERSFFGFYAVGAAAVEVERLERASSLLPPSRSLGYAHYLLGLRAKVGGDLGGARDRFEEARRIWTEAALPGHASSALDQLGSVALRQGEALRSIALYEAAAEASGRAGRRANAAVSRVNALLARADRGSPPGLSAALAAAERTLRLEGLHQQASHVAVQEARALAGEGAFEAARTRLGQVLEEARAASYGPARRGALGEAVRLARLVGEGASAAPLLEELEALACADPAHLDLRATCGVLRLGEPGLPPGETDRLARALEAIPVAALGDPHRLDLAHGLLDLALEGRARAVLPRLAAWLGTARGEGADDLARVLHGVRALAQDPPDASALAAAAQRLEEVACAWNRSLRALAAGVARVEAARCTGDEQGLRAAAAELARRRAALGLPASPPGEAARRRDR